jgi:ArsR family transcriptional regulator
MPGEHPASAPHASRQPDRQVYERRAQVIKALAHPSRLLIVDALTEGEKCVQELTQLVGCDMSTVSKHLAVMKAAGVVADRKQGLQVLYRLRVPCILHFFGCVDAVLRANERDWRIARRLTPQQLAGLAIRPRRRASSNDDETPDRTTRPSP